MRKEIHVTDEEIKIIEYRNKFLSFEEEAHEINVPVHLIKLVQKAYTDLEGTQSIAIFLETEDEYYISYDELDNIDNVFAEIISLKQRTEKFRVEEYNVETAETIER